MTYAYMYMSAHTQENVIFKNRVTWPFGGQEEEANGQELEASSQCPYALSSQCPHGLTSQCPHSLVSASKNLAPSSTLSPHPRRADTPCAVPSVFGALVETYHIVLQLLGQSCAFLLHGPGGCIHGNSSFGQSCLGKLTVCGARMSGADVN